MARMNRDSLLDTIVSPGAALLDGWSDAGRWTIALREPIDEFRVEWGQEGRLEEFLKAIRFEEDSGPNAEEIPFLRGWVGFISYEAGSRWEGAPDRDSNPPEPAALFFRHESGLAISPGGEAYVFGPGRLERIASSGIGSRELPGADAPVQERAGGAGRDPLLPLAARSRSKVLKLAASGKAGRVPRQDPLAVPSRFRDLEDSLAEPGYARAHDEIRRGIARGDYYQVNLTRRYSLRTDVRSDPRTLYRGLAGPNPPRYSALLLGGEFDVISASPELFLRADFESRRVEMKPIKGTALRDPDPAADRRAAEALFASPKDRAENVMIVDLCRNDLGRVCEPGSVRVSELCGVRSHRLHHLESTVEGSLLPGIGASDLIRATFPAGSVTGAPKRAAIGAISRLRAGRAGRVHRRRRVPRRPGPSRVQRRDPHRDLIGPRRAVPRGRRNHLGLPRRTGKSRIGMESGRILFAPRRSPGRIGPCRLRRSRSRSILPPSRAASGSSRRSGSPAAARSSSTSTLED